MQQKLFSPTRINECVLISSNIENTSYISRESAPQLSILQQKDISCLTPASEDHGGLLHRRIFNPFRIRKKLETSMEILVLKLQSFKGCIYRAYLDQAMQVYRRNPRPRWSRPQNMSNMDQYLIAVPVVRWKPFPACPLLWTSFQVIIRLLRKTRDALVSEDLDGRSSQKGANR